MIIHDIKYEGTNYNLQPHKPVDILVSKIHESFANEEELINTILNSHLEIIDIFISNGKYLIMDIYLNNDMMLSYTFTLSESYVMNSEIADAITYKYKVLKRKFNINKLIC